jgi:hypothetical protein
VSASAAPCSFCERPGTSKEHVFAQWLADVVVGEGDFNLKRSGGRSKQGLKTVGVTTRAACRKCNNEWMSRFEDAAKPLISPLIRDEPVRWASAAIQAEVARWAFKTALMFDRSSVPPDVSPPEHCTHLFRTRVPPPSVQIYLGLYRPRANETEFITVGAGAATVGRGDPGVPADLNGYRVTFNIGHVIFQIYGYAGTSKRDYEFARQLSVEGIDGQDIVIEDGFRQLWPLSLAPYEWPPRGGQFGTAELRMLEPLP